MGVVVVLLLVLLAVGQNAPYRAVVISFILATAISVTAWALLRTRTAQRVYEEQLTEWAAANAVQSERLRIARDLHDLASHGLGLITVRAATANLTDDEDDAERRQALSDIERVGRETTTELRGMLTLLRTGGEDPAPLSPAVSLTDLPRIIENARLSGVTVVLQQEDLGEAPLGVQLTICVVAREALANALRHAGKTRVSIAIQRDGTGITVDVRDDGPMPGWPPNPGTGNGLPGLRERLAVHRGTLTPGPTGTGFRLLAQIPGEAA